jgi:YhcH/YjgK/YiaL family protein
MVTDTLDNTGLYHALGPRIARALDWARCTNLAALEPGRHEIDGDAVFALVSDYATKPRADGRWEAHRRYLDLQIVARGEELIGWAPIGTLAGGDYIPEKDITWLAGDGSFVAMVPGRFMLLWPGDAHMPGIAANEPSPVRKLVVKIAV